MKSSARRQFILLKIEKAWKTQTVSVGLISADQGTSKKQNPKRAETKW